MTFSRVKSFPNSKKVKFKSKSSEIFFSKMGRVIFTKFSGFVGGGVPVRENLKIGGLTANFGVAGGQSFR